MHTSHECDMKIKTFVNKQEWGYGGGGGVEVDRWSDGVEEHQRQTMKQRQIHAV